MTKMVAKKNPKVVAMTGENDDEETMKNSSVSL